VRWHRGPNGAKGRDNRLPPRLCEKTIVSNQWAIYCRCSRRRRGEDFGYAILRAIGLLVFVKVMTFHTASTPSRPGCGYYTSDFHHH